MTDTPETKTPESNKAKIAFTSLFAGDDAYWVPFIVARKLERERDEAVDIARKAMGTVMQIYGHAQFCDECQSFEIADSCRIQMHDMDRINSLLTKCERNKNES